MFEAKTKLSEICQKVADKGEAVVVTKRGKPLVRIEPLERPTMTIRERREAYVIDHGKDEVPDEQDFEPGLRSREVSEFEIED